MVKFYWQEIVKIFKNIKLVIVFCFLPFGVISQVLPLDSILNRIEKNNPMLKMFDEQISAISNYSEGAKSWMPTTFTTGPWQTPYNDFRRGMWMFSSQQMIPNPTKQKANYNLMQGMSSVEKQGKGSSKNGMYTMAKQNYYEWIVLKKKYEVLVQTDSILQYVLKVARVRFTYNKEKLSNIYKAQADLFELRNMQTMFLADIKMKNTEINTLMNCNQSYVFEIDTTLQPKNYEVQLNDTALITSSRSDIKQYDARIDLVRLQQKVEQSKRLPDFGFSITHMQTYSVMPMPKLYSAMAMMVIPIAPFASKEYKANIKGLNNEANALSFQKKSLVNETTGIVTSLQTQIQSAKNQLVNYKQNIIPAYINSYRAALLSYEQNTEDLFLVLDGIKMYSMAKMNELDRLNTLLKLQVNYEREMEIR